MTVKPVRVVLLMSILFSCGLPGLVSAAEEGRALYLRHCAACHGDSGFGGVGVPLALPDFQIAVTDDYLAKTIRMGRPGRVMPAFNRLNDAEIDAIVKHIRSWSDAKPLAVEKGIIKGDVLHGKQLYQTHCVACHGDTGQGGKGTGVTFSRPRDLPIIAPALNNSGFLASASDGMIKNTLEHGRRDTPMVSFSKQGLSEKDLNDIVAFIRSLEKTAPSVSPVEKDTPAIMIAESDLSIETVLENLKNAITGSNFRLIRVQSFNDGLVEKGKESKEQIVVYFCNFDFLNRALQLDPRVGMFLPCRVTLVKDGDKVKIMTINPMKMSQLFNNAELDRACEEMTRIYETILEEASL